MPGRSCGAYRDEGRSGCYPLLMNLLVRWALNAFALWLTVQLNIGVSIASADLWSFLLAALIIGLVNAVVRPVMIVLTLPVTIVTFGLFLLVVNGLALAIAAAVSPLQLSGFGAAIIGSIVLSVISAILSRLFGDRARRS